MLTDKEIKKIAKLVADEVIETFIREKATIIKRKIEILENRYNL